ncbi:phosphotransferase family protein [Nocardioides antri]|uniref:Phosphotransferase family protein n=1 Tax=Nocardioides antri TaxID=2607659 RepID=A0A5B1M7H4_9ACTN|nr:phosphotransferase family protein [Nocardioides antri]KAA1427827.1 phosphotransferase family protein [Nocardioides antri]
MGAHELPGLDLGRLAPWLRTVVHGVGGDLGAELIAGGKSNLTYRLTDGHRAWIVRRPPLGHVLATAHDMAREYRVMSALQDTDVPVPTTYALCEDTDVLGAPFYVMEHVEGVPYRYARELAPLGPERTRAISENLVDVLAALHAVSPEAVGLRDFGRPEGFLGRQVARWKKQLGASHARDLPAADELHRRLAASVPAESATGIVHGDFRLDNVLTDAQDRPAAVIDWEMATLGDPLTDLALLVVYQRLGELVGGNAVADAASAPGFLTEDEILARYATHSDRDLSGLGFYLGLASYKLAAILEGIHYRHLQGQTVGPGFESIGPAVHPLLDAGLTALKEYR